MIVVVIAGGSGTRLWPLSTPDYPKHLLSLTNDKSLLQNTIDRVSQVTSTDKILVVSEASHIQHVYDQLPQLQRDQILVEPARRGTASCVLLALSAIKKRWQEDETVLFLWADHLIRNHDGFAASILRAGNLSRDMQKLVFMGIEPTYPSTGFGYMEKGAPLTEWQQAYELVRFKEKPDKKTAKEWFATGKYLWNTGYLTGLRSVFEREMEQNAPRLWKDYEKLNVAKDADIEKVYLDFSSEAIDIALSEKVADALVVPGSFDWADVGSFNDLHDISLQDDEGNHIKGVAVEVENTTNSYLQNKTNIPLAVIGLDGVVVVAVENGILVANKNYAQKVGDVAKRLQAKKD